jgi:hypothetical protein
LLQKRAEIQSETGVQVLVTKFLKKVVTGNETKNVREKY